LNGLPNCSILDGWWDEGYNGKNGWAIGEEREYHDQNAQDEADSLALYALLENEIVPAYFERGKDGLPHRWLALMREAIRTCAPAFSMRRMVKEYTTRFYVPEIQQSMQVEEKRYEKARVLAAWKSKVLQAWPNLEVYADGQRDGQLSLGEGITVRVWIKAPRLTPNDLNVELVYGEAKNEQITVQEKLPMGYIRQEQDGSYHYELRLQPTGSGSIAYGVRVLPTHPALASKHDMGLIRWA
ncbi:MAG: alpha-glucan phosphorylase, partial [Ktedonobacteraceae bacterium]